MVAVKWCEAEVRSFEWTNTFSNLIFAITAYVGWRLAKEQGLPFEFVAAELLLIVVFVGLASSSGTAGASWRAELLDELPMMLLAHAYLWSVRDIHPLDEAAALGTNALRGRGRADRRRRDMGVVAELCGVYQYIDFPVFPRGRHRVLRQ